MLKGLKSVTVFVEELDEDIENQGLRISTFRTDVELKLRMAGIKVLRIEEWSKEPSNPSLYVNVSCFKNETIGIIELASFKPFSKDLEQLFTELSQNISEKISKLK